MNDLLTLTGQDALTISRACNRQAEVCEGGQWRTASGLPEATRFYHVEAALVRLRAPLRVLVEDILRTAIPPGTDLRGAIQAAATNRVRALTDEVKAALAILQREIDQ